MEWKKNSAKKIEFKNLRKICDDFKNALKMTHTENI